jgi:hypothetical protein
MIVIVCLLGPTCVGSKRKSDATWESPEFRHHRGRRMVPSRPEMAGGARTGRIVSTAHLESKTNRCAFGLYGRGSCSKTSVPTREPALVSIGSMSATGGRGRGAGRCGVY